MTRHTQRKKRCNKQKTRKIRGGATISFVTLFIEWWQSILKWFRRPWVSWTKKKSVFSDNNKSMTDRMLSIIKHPSNDYDIMLCYYLSKITNDEQNVIMQLDKDVTYAFNRKHDLTITLNEPTPLVSIKYFDESGYLLHKNSTEFAENYLTIVENE